MKELMKGLGQGLTTLMTAKSMMFKLHEPGSR